MKKDKQEKQMRKEARLWLHAAKASIETALEQKDNTHLGHWIGEAERQIAGAKAEIKVAS